MRDYIFENRANETEIIPLNEKDYCLVDNGIDPALPFKNVHILLPPNSIINELKYDYEYSLVMQECTIIKSSVPISTNYSKLLDNEKNNKYEDYIYPASCVEYDGIYSMGGYTIANFIVFPFKYYPEKQELWLVNNVTISINTKSSRNTNNISKMMIDNTGTKKFVQSLIINPEEMNIHYKTTNLNMNASETIDYIIVTADSLVNSFKPLRDWKRQKGLRAEIIPLSYYENTYPSSNVPLSIKTGLLNHYLNNGVKWVLLGGDEEIIPSKKCYGRVGLDVDPQIPCDLYYSCLDNTANYSFDWDYDNDGVFGELEDSIDLYPEIIVSRLPVSNSDQVNNVITKIIDFERNPDKHFMDSILMVGSELNVTINGISDGHNKSELMYDEYINFSGSEWNGVKTRFYDTGTDFTGGANYDLIPTNLQEQLNNGYHYIHVATHGDPNGWDLEYNTYYSKNNSSLLNNSKYSVILTISCLTNAFDLVNTCLSESFIKNPNGGCIAYWGSSRYGWGSTHYSSLAYSFKYNGVFFNLLFSNQNPSIYNFGELCTRAKIITTKPRILSQYGAYRWLYFSLNPIGDPEMPLLTYTPDSLTNVTITYSGTDITVNTNGIQDCKIALTSKDSGESYFAVHDSVSTATFYNVLCPFNVVITKRNYVPYCFSEEDVYIQNYSFNSNAHIKGRNIYIGNDVLPNSVSGDVYVTSGNNVILEAEQNVIIKNGFIVENSAYFEIK